MKKQRAIQLAVSVGPEKYGWLTYVPLPTDWNLLITDEMRRERMDPVADGYAQVTIRQEDRIYDIVWGWRTVDVEPDAINETFWD